MATNRSRGDPDEQDDRLEGDLPDPSMLGIEDYLEMARAAASRPRYEILRRLVYSGSKSPTQLKAEIDEELDIDDSTLYYHLNELVEVGLISKRARTEQDQEGFDTSYEATIFGEKALTGGLDDLMENEHDFDAMYNSDA